MLPILGCLYIHTYIHMYVCTVHMHIMKDHPCKGSGMKVILVHTKEYQRLWGVIITPVPLIRESITWKDLIMNKWHECTLMMYQSYMPICM
jgi:hypothetical protein